MTHKWRFIIEIEFDRPPANAEEERRARMMIERLADPDVWNSIRHDLTRDTEFHLTPRAVIAVPAGRMP